MNKMALWTIWLNNTLSEKLNEERGAGLAEYALLLFVVAVAAATVITAFGADIIAAFTEATDTLPSQAP